MSICAVYATFRVAVRKFKKNQHYKKSRTRKLFTDGNPVSQSPISSPSSFCACVLCFISQVETLAFLRQGIASACMIHFVSAPKSGKRIISRPFKDCNFSPCRLFNPPVATQIASGKNRLAIIAVFSLSTMATGLSEHFIRCSPNRHCLK